MDIKLEKNISDIADNHYNYLLNLPNVNGVGLGYKYIKGLNTLEPCIHVLVENKINAKYLPKNNLIPSTYMGIKTDVINIGRILTKEEFSNSNNQINSLNTNQNSVNKFSNDDFSLPIDIKKYRPLQAGCCIGYAYNNGTLGCIVTKIVDGEKNYYILTSGHVMENEKGKIVVGSEILQPSYDYGGWFLPQFFNRVATVETFKEEKLIEGNKEPWNYVDCGLARINNLSLISDEVIDVGPITGRAVAFPELFVQKYGFFTGLTEGVITSANTTLYIGKAPKRALYKRQLNIYLDSHKGDSGSAILDMYGGVVGLLMAGTNDGFTIANNIREVIDALNIEIYTEKNQTNL